MTKTVNVFIIPRRMVERLGANLAPGHDNHARGGAVLDGFLGADGEPIDWHEGEDGDYDCKAGRPQAPWGAPS